MDVEDIKQVRVLIPIEEIDNSSGPMHVLSAQDTDKVYDDLKLNKKISYRSDRISDEIMNRYNVKQNTLTIKKNEIAFIDTCRCYHYGSRKSSKVRKVISLQFTSAFSIFTPIFNRNINPPEFNERLSQLIFCFLNDNYAKIRFTKLKKWQIKIL